MIQTKPEKPCPTNQIVINGREKNPKTPLHTFKPELQCWAYLLLLQCGDRESSLQIARADSFQNHSTDVSKRLDGIQELDEGMTVSYL